MRRQPECSRVKGPFVTGGTTVRVLGVYRRRLPCLLARPPWCPPSCGKNLYVSHAWNVKKHTSSDDIKLIFKFWMMVLIELRCIYTFYLGRRSHPSFHGNNVPNQNFPCSRILCLLQCHSLLHFVCWYVMAALLCAFRDAMCTDEYINSVYLSVFDGVLLHVWRRCMYVHLLLSNIRSDAETITSPFVISMVAV